MPVTDDVTARETDQDANSAAVARAPEGSGRVRRLNQRFLATWRHPFWATWRRESAEDEGFVAGTRQWPSEIKRALEAKGKACVTINQVRPVVGVVIGYERSSRMDLTAEPEGQEDLENATLLSRLMKKTMTDLEAEFTLSDEFRTGVVRGLGCVYVGTDYTENPINGEITFEELPAGSYCWDVEWKKYDLSDARDVFWHKLVPVDVLKAQYPEKEQAIDAAVNLLEGANGDGEFDDLVLPDSNTKDNDYKADSLDALPLFDRREQSLRVVEAWERTWETVWLLVDQEKNDVQEVNKATMDIARKLVDVSPALKLIKRQRRRVDMTVFLPAGLVELEHGNPFDNDTSAYPFVPFVAYREDGQVFGLVRNLKDPQREVNKRRSAMIDNVSGHGSTRWLSTRGALENPEFLEGNGQSVGWLRNPNVAPKETTPPQMPEWIVRQDQLGKLEIREISGINSDLLGVRDADSSGVAIARRQQQGQIITSDLFDNYRRTRRIVGKRIAKRIQQIYTGEMTVRLKADSGETEFVKINTTEVDAQGRKTVVRDVPNLKYDVTITDTAATPTARAHALNVLMDLLQKWPQLAPALADIIIEMTDIPNREKVLGRVKEIVAKAGFGPDAAPAPGQPAPKMLAQGGNVSASDRPARAMADGIAL